jgi:thioredoxin-related protein
MMKLVLVKIVLVAFFSTFIWGANLETAKEQAKKENKSILLYFSGSDWCGPCIKLKQEVLENEAFTKYSESHLVMVRADFPRMKKNQLSKEQTQYNESLAEKYNPNGKFPLTVLLSADGQVLKELDGYPKSLTVESLIKILETTHQ